MIGLQIWASPLWELVAGGAGSSILLRVAAVNFFLGAFITVPLSDQVAALGRTPTIPSPVINAVEPGTSYGDRLNQLDMRLAKVLNFAGMANLRASLDIHNILNNNAVSREFHTLANYLQPQEVQAGRLFRVSFQFNF